MYQNIKRVNVAPNKYVFRGISSLRDSTTQSFFLPLFQIEKCPRMADGQMDGPCLVKYRHVSVDFILSR